MLPRNESGRSRSDSNLFSEQELYFRARMVYLRYTSLCEWAPFHHRHLVFWSNQDCVPSLLSVRTLLCQCNNIWIPYLIPSIKWKRQAIQHPSSGAIVLTTFGTVVLMIFLRSDVESNLTNEPGNDSFCVQLCLSHVFALCPVIEQYE